jgi:amino-acid N-acetyltransferase
MKVADLRGILQYVPRFRDRTFVVAVDGEIAASPNFSNILLDLAVLRSLNIRVILVHGAGFQIQQMAADRGIAISSADGTGVIDDVTLKLSLEAATNVMNEIMQGLTSVDLRTAYANAIIAHPAGILGGVDQQHAGRVERVDTQALEFFLSQGIIPLIPPLGFDGEGRTFRVNSDGIAVEVAEAMRAMKIIFLTGEDGLSVNGEFIRQLSVAEAEELTRKRRSLVAPKLLSKLDHGARACRQGVPRVHLLNGNVNEALLAEIFSPDGIGTMVYSNEYQQIRRLFKKDVRAVMALIRQSVDSEELVRRTRADILAHLEDYWVLEIDRNLIGCVAVHLYPEDRKAELACLYIARNQEGFGYGRRMMAFAERLAAERGMTHLFALSTQAFNYFQQKGGFQQVSANALPAERRKKYDSSGRNSKVLEKKLTPTAQGSVVAAASSPEPPRGEAPLRAG